MQIFRNTLLARDNCEKEYSNCQTLTVVTQIEYVRKSHAVDTAAHFSGSYVEKQQCTVTVVKKNYSEEKGLHCKWNSDYIACRFY